MAQEAIGAALRRGPNDARQSKCRCVLTTVSMPARSKSCVLWMEAGIEVSHRRVQLHHAGVDQHAPIGMIDDVHVDRHPLALGEQVGNTDWRDDDLLDQ